MRIRMGVASIGLLLAAHVCGCTGDSTAANEDDVEARFATIFECMRASGIDVFPADDGTPADSAGEPLSREVQEGEAFVEAQRKCMASTSVFEFSSEQKLEAKRNVETVLGCLEDRGYRGIEPVIDDVTKALTFPFLDAAKLGRSKAQLESDLRACSAKVGWDVYADDEEMKEHAEEG